MPIYGDHAFAYRATAASVSGIEIVRRIKEVIEYVPSPPPGATADMVGHHWEQDPVQISTINAANGLSTSDFYLLLRPVQQTWTVGDEPSDNDLDDPNDQQVLFHGTADQVRVVYAPAGGINEFNYDYAFTPGIDGPPANQALTTGKRQLSSAGTNSITAANSNGRFWFAEYRDQEAVTKFPFSSLFIGFESGTTLPNTFRYCINVGRIVSPYNLNDPKIAPAGPAITGDGLFIGPTGSGAGAFYGNNFFLGNWTIPTTGPCIRVGNTWAEIIVENNVNADNALLNDVNGKERLVPYEIFAQISTTETPLIGYTKHVRQFKQAISVQPTVLKNSIPGSAQAWLGWIPVNGTLDNNNQIALWNKYPVLL